uniref:PH domain-containing protein n=1 Tax=Salmo trutta TaxID=8032 RepID=A0A674DCA3_SALTR
MYVVLSASKELRLCLFRSLTIHHALFLLHVPCSTNLHLSLPGGFMFKQWKERYLILTADGCVLVSRDAVSPPDQMVALQGGCEAIVEGREILDLPKLPSGGSRDCCFALILPQEKFLLLLADNAEDCSYTLFYSTECIVTNVLL